MTEGAAPSRGTVLAVRGAVVDAGFDAGALPQIDEELVAGAADRRRARRGRDRAHGAARADERRDDKAARRTVASRQQSSRFPNMSCSLAWIALTNAL
jgi:hypothetical protein